MSKYEIPKFDVAGTLKRLRAKSKMTANEVGALVGKSGKTVNAWEHGHGQPDADMLIKLSQIYHVENMLEEFRAREPQIHADTFHLSEHERSLIIAYRAHPEFHAAIDSMLRIEKKEAESDAS